MATRDLTMPYTRLRSALHRRRPGDDGMGSMAGAATGGMTASLIPGGGGGGGAAALGVDTSALTGAAPVYVEAVTDLSADLYTITARMADLQKAHEARLRIAFDPESEAAKEREVEIMTAEITRMFNGAKRKLNDINKYDGGDPASAEGKIRKNIQRGIATRMFDLSNTFRTSQKAYLGQLTKMRSSGSIASLLGGGGGGAAGGVDRDEGFTDAQMSELANAEEDVDERMREIQRIAKSVEELATMFNELAVLVVEQGTLLDRIDKNLEEAVAHTIEGKKNLEKAEEHQKSARPITCMIVLMVLIIICVIIIVVKGSQ